jgi:DNA-binding NtrC family response regulator
VDIRFIAATNRDLKELVRQGRFRDDLFYRLDVYNILVPPLRARSEDIPLLAATFLQQLAADTDKPVRGFTDAAMDVLGHYTWPGNIRELRNAVERALLSCKGNEIDAPDLPYAIVTGVSGVPATDGFLERMGEQGLDPWLEEVERRAILQALEASNGVQVQAAKRLGISERSLWHRIKKLNIQISRVIA